MSVETAKKITYKAAACDRLKEELMRKNSAL